jgi:hypothetical protein
MARKSLFFIYNMIETHIFYPCYFKRASMKIPVVLCVLLVCLCLAVLITGCTSSNAPAPTGSASVTTAPAVATTPACPDKLVWDGAWDSRYLGMAGNHDLSTAWTKYKDRAYGDEASVKMTQTCWDVEGTLIDKGIKCEATFKGSVVKNTLSGTWSASTMCGTKAENGKISLTMAADNKSWLGDFYSAGQDPSLFPPNWAGRRNS